MSIINRIDEFFRLNKNKEKPSEISLVNPHQRSFSAGTTTNDSQLKSLQDEGKTNKDKDDLKENPLSAYKENPNCQKDVKDLTNVKGIITKIPIKERDGRSLNKAKRFQQPKRRYLSSSSFRFSSDDEDLEPIKESSTEQLTSQNKKEQNMMKEPPTIINKPKEEFVKGKREEYKEDRINKIPEVQQGKNQIMFADIHEAKSEIYRPAVPVAKEVIKKEVLEPVIRFADNQDPLESYKKKKNVENLNVCQPPQHVFKNEKAKEGPLNLALELLKKFPLEQLSLMEDGSFDKNVGSFQHYEDLCCLANQDPVQFHKQNLKEDPSKLALKALTLKGGKISLAW